MFMYFFGTIIFFLPFLGSARKFDGDISPLRFLEIAFEWFATANKPSPKKTELHFQLVQVLEEQHCIQDINPLRVFFWVIVTRN